MVEIKEDNFLIENQDLIGAIESSLMRGETLKDAMVALHNAGYEKAKIEEAARSYIELSKNSDKNKFSHLAITSSSVSDIKKEELKKEKPVKVNILDKALAARAIHPTLNAVNIGGADDSTSQQVSKYDFKENKEKPKSKIHHASSLVTLLLIFVLVFLLLILGSVFLFKNELVDFFNRLFS